MRRAGALATTLGCLLAAVPAGGGPPATGDAAFRVVGPFYDGSASVPWHATFSPDGRWVAFVEGHPGRFVAVHDAKTRRLVWRETTAAQPASLRPAFTRDGERLVLVEGTDLVTRARTENGWEVRERTPLGFTPSITATCRAISLAPDERSAAFCDGDRAWRVDLGGEVRRTEAVGPPGAVAVHHLPEGLAVARWTGEAAETVLPPNGSAASRTVPMALLAATPDGTTWLVAREPRPPGERPPTLSLVDAATRRVLADYAVSADVERGWAFLGAAEFTPDGRHLVTVESLRLGFVREARTGRQVQTIREYEGDRMIGIALSPDGRHLLTGGRRAGEDVEDRAVLLWERAAPADAVPEGSTDAQPGSPAR